MGGSFALSPRIRTPSINPGEIIEIDIYITGVGDVPADIKLNTSYPASILKIDENGYVGLIQTCVIVGKDRKNKISSIATGNSELTDSITGKKVLAIQKFPQTQTGSTLTLNEGFFLSSQTIAKLQRKKIDVRDKRIVGESSWDGHPPIYLKLNTSTDAPLGDHSVTLTLFYHDGNGVQRDQKEVVVHIKNGREQHQEASIIVEGDVHGDVTQAYKGDVTIIKVNSYDELIRTIKDDKTLSQYGKDETIKNISIIRKELKKEQPDIGLIKRSWEWIKKHGPRIAEGVLVRLIPRLIMLELGE